MSDGKAIDLGPFSGAILTAMRSALPSAYLPPTGSPRPATPGGEKLTLKQAVYRVIASAYDAVAAAGIGAPPRMLYYKCRPEILRLTLKGKLDYDKFKDRMNDFIDEHPEITAEWSILYDDRGTFIEPGGASIGLGTRAFDGYIRLLGRNSAYFEPAVGNISIEHDAPTVIEGDNPAHRFSAVVFIEKEGYRELIAKAKIAERFDVAFASTKGVSNIALRRLLDELANYGTKVFVLHDIDEAGFKIAHHALHFQSAIQSKERDRGRGHVSAG